MGRVKHTDWPSPEIFDEFQIGQGLRMDILYKMASYNAGLGWKLILTSKELQAWKSLHKGLANLLDHPYDSVAFSESSDDRYLIPMLKALNGPNGFTLFKVLEARLIKRRSRANKANS